MNKRSGAARAGRLFLEGALLGIEINVSPQAARQLVEIKATLRKMNKTPAESPKKLEIISHCSLPPCCGKPHRVFHSRAWQTT
jgi:hypothetical protein